MAAILRIKRKKDDDALDALLISCKRQKVDSKDAEALDPITTIVKFAGTVEKQDDEYITKTLNKNLLKENYKQHFVDITKKLREQKREESIENRYKVVNSIRSLDTSKLMDFDENVVNIIDIESTQNVSDDKSNVDYVFDLYFTKTQENIQIENLLSIYPVENELVFEECYNDKDSNDSEDSNSESNWRNDYPDSENSDEDEDLQNAMKNLCVDDLSSDDSDDEDFVYGLDEDIVERYGYKYAKYKARMEKEEKDSASNESDNDDCVDYDCNDIDTVSLDSGDSTKDPMDFSSDYYELIMS